jgi:hypothetical protein
LREAQAADPPNATRQADDFKVAGTEEGIQLSMYVEVVAASSNVWEQQEKPKAGAGIMR